MMAELQGVAARTGRYTQRTSTVSWRKMALLSLLLLSLASAIVCQSTTDRAAGLWYTGPSDNGTGVVITSTVSGVGGPGRARTCRDRLGTYTPDQFRQFACGMCFMYLYNGKVKTLLFHQKNQFMYVFNATGQVVSFVKPHVDDPDAVDTVCSEIGRAGEDCNRWTRCCRSATECCDRQLASKVTPGLVGSRTFTSEGSSGGGVGGYCPRTWDGYSCWDDTEADRSVSTFCPTYIEHSFPNAKATKRCTENGTWFVSQESMQEWTDYTGCVTLDEFEALFWVNLICHIVSLILLTPACFIFLYFRSLRNQHRIRLHVCLFTSFILTNLLMILWEIIVVNNRLNNKKMEDSVLHQNSVGCRMLHALTRYTWTTNFLWMWLEGFHLYRLMVHAFNVPRSLFGFYIGGFTAPLVPTLIYVIIRSTRDDLNIQCWVPNAGDFEWIIYTPIIFCLVGNVFFLGKILWVMLNQLQSHPNEPSSYRRAVKAVGILIPLFGLQVLLVIYQPQPPIFALDIFSRILTNTQGATVALGFCYFNGEVLTVIRNALPRSMRTRSLLRSDQRSTMSTQFTTDIGSRSTASHYNTGTARAGVGANGTCYASQHEHNASYIPLTTMGDEGPGVRSGVVLHGKEGTVRNGLA